MSQISTSSALVSVVIPMYNAEPYVSDAIESVLAQTHTEIECLVVDDGSTDASGEIAAGYPVEYLQQPNMGVSAARNAGIGASRGPLIAFLDADDVWVPEKLERQIATLDRRSDIGLVYTGLHETNEELHPTTTRLAPTEDVAFRNTLLLEPPVVSLSQTGLVPRNVLDDVGGFDTRLTTSADTDMVIRIGLRYSLVCVPEPLVLYRMHPNQMSLNADAMEHDMEIVLDKAFSAPNLPPDLRRLRRRAYANLRLAVGGSRLEGGRRCDGMRDFLRAWATAPVRTTSVLAGGAAKRLTGRK